MTFSRRVATGLGRGTTTTRSLESPDSVSGRNEKMGEPAGTTHAELQPETIALSAVDSVNAGRPGAPWLQQRLENSSILLHAKLSTDGKSLVQIKVSARYHQLDQVCDRRKCGGVNCLELADTTVSKCGETHGLTIIGFHFSKPDI